MGKSSKNISDSLLGFSNKGLIFAHLNICSLRNKVDEINQICLTNGVHILALSETHLDESVDDSSLTIGGYNLHRRDRNKYGGGVGLYIQEDIVAVVREDLMNSEIEILWIQIHIPHSKPTLISCCYRPPNSNASYLDGLCENFDKVCDEGKNVFILGDLNINWFSKNCPLYKRLNFMTSVCHLSQIVNQATRFTVSKDSFQTSTCIDHIFTNVPELCSQAVSMAVGCSDHNLIAVSKKAKLPKSGARIILRRSFQRFNPDLFLNDINNLQWSDVCEQQDVNIALNTFMYKLMQVVNKHAPIRKKTIRSSSAPWVDNELRSLMLQRDKAKAVAQISEIEVDWRSYRKLRNQVTKLNHVKKSEYFKQKKQ